MKITVLGSGAWGTALAMLLLEKERLLYELTNTLSGFPVRTAFF